MSAPTHNDTDVRHLLRHPPDKVQSRTIDLAVMETSSEPLARRLVWSHLLPTPSDETAVDEIFEYYLLSPQINILPKHLQGPMGPTVRAEAR